MSRGLALALALALAACTSHDAAALGDAIVGRWDELCHTDAEAKSTCLGKEDVNVMHTFKTDGTLELTIEGRPDQPPMRGTWKLAGDDVTFSFDGGGMAIVEKYRARIADGHLVLWKTDGPFGTVLGRHGAPFTAEASPMTSGGKTRRAIDDVHYTIDLPAGYRLARDDNHRQTWQPAHGAGLEVRLTLGPRAHKLVDNKPVMEPCPPGEPGVSGASETIDGVERETDVGIDICLGPDQSIMCSAGHTRGYLNPDEKPAAIALCKSLAIEH